MGEQKKRLYNLDLIRIVAMIMIVGLHFLGKTGLWDIFPVSSLGYNLVWAAVTFFNVSVNVFVLISGYFLFNSTFKFSKLVALWLEVLFYSVLIYVGLIATHQVTLNPADLLSSVFPIITGKYWFITMYVGMYVLSPFLNKMIRSLNQREHGLLIVILALFTGVWPIIGGLEVQSYALHYGFSVAWFVVLYNIAAYFRAYYKPDYQTAKHLVRYLFVALASIVAVLGSAYLGTHGIEPFVHLRGILNGYTSITVLPASVLLFVAMLNLKITRVIPSKLIKFFAPLTLGVYLIHEERHLADLLWKTLNPADHIHQPTFLLYALACIFGIYLAASLIDWLRQGLFKFLYKMVFKDFMLWLRQYKLKISKKDID